MFNNSSSVAGVISGGQLLPNGNPFKENNDQRPDIYNEEVNNREEF
jgi:hypothetical protein